jgi:cellulose synthase/poly-beta-1,6-N-acetylglucosamine synthase-like glycosyltransferase
MSLVRARARGRWGPEPCGPDHLALLAADLDLPCASPHVAIDLRPAGEARFLPAFAAGIVALAPNPQGWRYAMTPTPDMARLSRRHALAGRRDVVLIERAGFRAMLRRHAAANLADHAAHDLGRRHPGLSAEGAGNVRQRLGLLALVLCLCFLALSAPNVAISVAALLTLPIFLLLVLLRCGAAIEAIGPAPPPRMRLKDDDLPVYTVLVPLCREASVVPDLVAALTRLDYPSALLEIKFLVECDDAATLGALEAARLPSHMEIVIVPDGRPRTKPRALNVGLHEARGALVTVYDAEDRPDPRQLRTAANLFARLPAHIVCLQGRLVVDNVDDSWLTRMFALEYAGLFDIINAGLMRARLPVLLGGTSNHFRADALRAAGGWDAFNVTEDADLAFRLMRAGHGMADLPSATLEEAPARFSSWRRQRTRWMKGFIQTLVTHTRHPGRLLREAGLVNTVTLLALCGGAVLSALCYPIFLALTLGALLTWGFPAADTAFGALVTGLWVGLFLCGLAAIYLPVVLGARRRGLMDLWPWIVLKPIYCCLISVAAWAAVVELFTAPTRWNKTEHGLARTSRTGASLMAPPRSAPEP